MTRGLCSAAIVALTALAGCANPSRHPMTPAEVEVRPQAQTAPASPLPRGPSSLDQLSFLYGNWAGERADGSRLTLQFKPGDFAIIVRQGGNPLYIIVERGDRVVAEAALDSPTSHFGRLTWQIRQLGPDVVAFGGITHFRWRRISEDLLEDTFFEPDGDGFREVRTILRRVPEPEPAPRPAPVIAPAVTLTPAQPRISYGNFELLGPPNVLRADEMWVREHIGEIWGTALYWRSSDGAAAMIVTDDGRTLRAYYITRAPRLCVYPDFYLQYEGPPFDLLSRQRLQNMVSERSPCIAPELGQAHSREFNSAQADLDRALAAMRLRARQLYGSLERCMAPSGYVHPALTDPRCR